MSSASDGATRISDFVRPNVQLGTDSPNVPEASRLPLGEDRRNVPAWRDWLGVAASVACAIHCAAMPLVVSFLPLLGLDFLAEPAFHQWMVAVCVAIAIVAFIPGWGRHRRCAPGAIAVVGLALISAGAFSEHPDCCPAGSAAALGVPSTVSAAPHESSSAGSVNADCELSAPTGCTSACVLACSDSSEPESADQAGTDEPGVSAARSVAVPIPTQWFMPVGGLLLIAGHLLNHRCNCRCACTATSDARTRRAFDGDDQLQQ